MTDNQRIAYQELAELDLDSIAQVADADLDAFFAELAGRATAGQLAQFLGLSLSTFLIEDDESESHKELTRMFVERRVRVVREMRAMASVSLGMLDEIESRNG